MRHSVSEALVIHSSSHYTCSDSRNVSYLTLARGTARGLTINLAANVTVITLVRKSIADIKAGDYVAPIPCVLTSR